MLFIKMLFINVHTKQLSRNLIAPCALAMPFHSATIFTAKSGDVVTARAARQLGTPTLFLVNTRMLLKRLNSTKIRVTTRSGMTFLDMVAKTKFQPNLGIKRARLEAQI